MAGSTKTTGLSTPTSLVANDLSRVAFLDFFNVDGEAMKVLMTRDKEEEGSWVV